MNVRVAEDDQPGWVDGVHWGMVKVYGDLIPMAVELFKLFGVEENKL